MQRSRCNSCKTPGQAGRSVTGVAYVDVDVFDTISESGLLDGFDKSAAASLTVKPRIVIATARIADDGSAVLPAQLAYLTPEVADTLILQEMSWRTGENF